MNHNDIEKQIEIEAEVSVRLGFVRKVYGIVGVQLAVTALFVAATFTETYKPLFSNILLVIPALIGFLVLTVVMICFKNLLRQVPVNYVLLFIWTSMMAFLTAIITSEYDAISVLTAALGTIVIVGALTIYAFTTKTDYSICTALMFCVAASFMLLSFFGWVFGFYQYARFAYSMGGVFIFSIYIIIDTQLILGNLGTKFDTDDYIFAAMTLYMDIIRLFLEILKLIGKKK